MLQIVILRHREDGEDEHERLEDAHDLRIGKALLAIEDKGTDAAEGGDVGHHGIREIGAAVERIVIFADEKCPAHKAGEEDDEDAVDGDKSEIPRDGQRPAAHECEYGIDDDDVQTQDAVDERVGYFPMPMEQIADDKREEQIGKEIDDAKV